MDFQYFTNKCSTLLVLGCLGLKASKYWLSWVVESQTIQKEQLLSICWETIENPSKLLIFKTIVLRCLMELEAGTGSVGKLRVSSFLFFHCFRWKHSLGVSKLRKHRCMVFWTNYWTKSRPSGNRVVVRTENSNMSYSPSLCASKYLSACRIFWPINISSTNKKVV